MTSTASTRVTRLLAAALILGAALARIVYLGWLTPLALAPDEAHYWDWSRQLDWAYYSKGPLVALLIRASCEIFGALSLSLTGSEALAVRLPAVICGALLNLATYVLIVQVWRNESWALAGMALTMTSPIVAAGASLITIDAPFTCLWAWSLVTGFEAIVRRRTWAWPTTGLLIALGILAKPTMVLWLPCCGLLILATPSLRPLFRGREFWSLVGAACLGAIPILVWNAGHEWVTFRHTQSHVGMTSRQFIHWLGPLNYLGTQMALLFVYWFVAWAGAMWRFRPWTDVRLEERYLWFLSFPIFAFFGLFAFKNGGGEPNWPIAAYLAGMVLALGWVQEQLHTAGEGVRRAHRWGIATAAGLGVAAIGLVHFPFAARPILAALAGPPTSERTMPLRRLDPTARMRGWPELAAAVADARRDLQARGVDPILAGTSWTLPGELRFYLPDRPPVYSLGRAFRERHSQYDLWHPNPVADPQAFAGKTFLVVNGSAATLREMFDEVESLAPVEYREGGHLISSWTLAIGRGYRGVATAPAGY